MSFGSEASNQVPDMIHLPWPSKNAQCLGLQHDTTRCENASTGSAPGSHLVSCYERQNDRCTCCNCLSNHELDKARASKQKRQGSALTLGWPQGEIILDLFGSTSLWFLSYWTYELLPPLAKSPCKVCLLDTADQKFTNLEEFPTVFVQNPNIMSPNVRLCLAQDGSHSPVLNFHSATYMQTWWKSFDASSKISGANHPKLFMCSAATTVLSIKWFSHWGPGKHKFQVFCLQTTSRNLQTKSNKRGGRMRGLVGPTKQAFRLHCFHCQKPYRMFEPFIVAGMLNQSYEAELISSRNTLLRPTHLG